MTDETGQSIWYKKRENCLEIPFVKFIDGVNVTGKKRAAYLTFLDDDIVQPEKQVLGFHLKLTSFSTNLQTQDVFDDWIEEVSIPKAGTSSCPKILLINALDAGNLLQKFFFTCFQNNIHIQFFPRDFERTLNLLH